MDYLRSLVLDRLAVNPDKCVCRRDSCGLLPYTTASLHDWRLIVIVTLTPYSKTPSEGLAARIPIQRSRFLILSRSACWLFGRRALSTRWCRLSASALSITTSVSSVLLSACYMSSSECNSCIVIFSRISSYFSLARSITPQITNPA